MTYSKLIYNIYIFHKVFKGKEHLYRDCVIFKVYAPVTSVADNAGYANLLSFKLSWSEVLVHLTWMYFVPFTPTLAYFFFFFK